ncbi:choice-of-anchor X domain-containing protein [Roseateles sp.]|uniref:choice-of-anchor X domain-containing protein n=1 Tax=Roseateles sp. TaxID=1971397 RepID=UPI00286AF9EA|nr:choice-of-anchor X domain-containing protein [Roseateles sp.]
MTTRSFTSSPAAVRLRRLAGFSLLASAATLNLISAPAGAQTSPVPQVAMNTPQSLTGKIVPGMSRLELPFVLGEASSLALDVIVPVDGASLSLVAPDGSIAAASGGAGVRFHPGSALPQPAPGGVFEIGALAAPANGQWKLVLDFPAPNYSTVVIATLRAVSRLQAGIAIERTTLLVGEDVSIGMLLTDNGQPKLGLAPQISVTPVNQQPLATAVPALDNGSGPDGLANDGLYSIDHLFSQAGAYDIRGTATLPTAQGPVQRAASLRVNVIEPSLTNANVTLSNLLGSGACVNGLQVAVSFSAQQDRPFASLIQLAGSNGKTIDSRAAFSSSAGAAATQAVFSARDIKDKIGVDGPYQVSAITVLDVGGDEFTQAFRRNDAGSFTVPLSNLCAQPIEFPGSLSVTPVLKAGFIGSLDISIPVKVTVSGFYQISYKVFGAGGEDLGLINASRQLTAGVNNVLSNLATEALLKSEGPYQVVSLLVVGGGAAERKSTVGQSAAISRWQFYPKISGDLNGDDSVDALDNALMTQFRNTAALIPGDRRDLNKDGVVNLLDARALQKLACKKPACPVNP